VNRDTIFDRIFQAVVEVGNSSHVETPLSAFVAKALEGAFAKDFPAMLPIWAAQSAGQPCSLTVDVASAWLGLYLAAKLVDDVQDGDVSLLGPDVPPSVAINVALCLIFAAYACLAGEGETDKDVNLRVQLQRLTARVCLQMANVQQATVCGLGEGEPLRAAWEIASAKGGIPLEFGCRLGAISVGALPDVVEGLANFGRLLGEAVQAIDDMVGLARREQADLGSPANSLALGYALAVADAPDRGKLGQLLDLIRHGGTGATHDLWAMLDEMGARQYLALEASLRLVKARQVLAELEPVLIMEGARKLRLLVDSMDPLAARGRESD